jgi:hypothetical protein
MHLINAINNNKISSFLIMKSVQKINYQRLIIKSVNNDKLLKKILIYKMNRYYERNIKITKLQQQ